MDGWMDRLIDGMVDSLVDWVGELSVGCVVG